MASVTFSSKTLFIITILFQFFTSPEFTLDGDPEDNYDFFSEINLTQCKYHTVSQYNSLFDKNTLSFVNSNIRSFNRNFDSLNSIFSNKNLPSVFCLTETRFKLSTLQNIPGYVPFHTVRDSDMASGGISLFVIDSINATKIDSLSYCNSTIEICTTEFKIGNQHVIVLGVYRPHSDSIDNFNTLFSDILNNKLLKNKTCVILGDLNICLLKPNNPNSNFSNLLYSHHFNPLLTKATPSTNLTNPKKPTNI